MRKLPRALLAGSLGLAAPLLAGCGSGAGLLSGDQASTLQNQLNQISAALSAGHCSTVRSATQTLASQVASLPSNLNPRLRQDLDHEASQVTSLAVQQCHPVSNPSTTPATTPTQTTPTNTATTPTTPTTPTTTTPTTTTPTTPTTPATTPTTPGTNGGSSGGGGLGGGSGVGTDNANGNGSGNG